MAPEVQATDLERGYHPEILGEYAERQQSKNRLLGVAVLSIIGIFLIVYSDFASVRLALLLMLCLPIALTGGNRPGQEIEHPMAIVIIGGLFTSTLLNLLFMPALYWKFAKTKSQRNLENRAV